MSRCGLVSSVAWRKVAAGPAATSLRAPARVILPGLHQGQPRRLPVKRAMPVQAHMLGEGSGSLLA